MKIISSVVNLSAFFYAFNSMSNLLKHFISMVQLEIFYFKFVGFLPRYILIRSFLSFINKKLSNV